SRRCGWSDRDDLPHEHDRRQPEGPAPAVWIQQLDLTVVRARLKTLQGNAQSNGQRPRLWLLCSGVRRDSRVETGYRSANRRGSPSRLREAVRSIELPADARVRVFGGDPGPGDNRSRETAAVSVLKEQVFQKHGKALVIYGAAHFYRTMPRDYLSSMGEDVGIARMLEVDYPGRTFVVIPVGWL